jgi:hypothetical protein
LLEEIERKVSEQHDASLRLRTLRGSHAERLPDFSRWRSDQRLRRCRGPTSRTTRTPLRTVLRPRPRPSARPQQSTGDARTYSAFIPHLGVRRRPHSSIRVNGPVTQRPRAPPRTPRRAAVLRHQRDHRRPGLGDRGRPRSTPTHSGSGWSAPALRATPAPTCARRRDGARTKLIRSISLAGFGDYARAADLSKAAERFGADMTEAVADHGRREAAFARGGARHTGASRPAETAGRWAGGPRRGGYSRPPTTCSSSTDTVSRPPEATPPALRRRPPGSPAPPAATGY